MQLRPSQRANLPNPLQPLLKQLPDKQKDEARDRAHAAGNLAAARELGGNLLKIATNLKCSTTVCLEVFFLKIPPLPLRTKIAAGRRIGV
jgi:hypothetical protein